jgi:hypothetical protein
MLPRRLPGLRSLPELTELQRLSLRPAVRRRFGVRLLGLRGLPLQAGAAAEAQALLRRAQM